ncbi:universal stress protein [Hwanghaeella sp.]|uniref:universal stress protein n=1 Tax=Hwanghaeella sp. TaxID=2605943 RepID=UPI003CCC2768
MANVLVVGFEPSPAGERAVTFAVDLAKLSGSSLHIVHVLEWSPYSFLTPEEIEERHARRKEELSRAKESIIDPLVKKLGASGVSVETSIRYGHVAETLAAVAKDAGASQIIVGRTGAPGLASRLFGSVAGALAQASPVPCTIVP